MFNSDDVTSFSRSSLYVWIIRQLEKHENVHVTTSVSLKKIN